MNSAKTMSRKISWLLLAALLLGVVIKPAQAGTEEVVAGVILGALLVTAARDDEHYRHPRPALPPTHRLKHRKHEHHARCEHAAYAHPSARGRGKGKQFAPGHARYRH